MTQLCVVTVYVTDMQDAREFYCNKLGFEIAREYGDCILQLKNQGVTLIIERIEGGYPDKPCTVIATQTSDLVAEMERLRSSGVAFIHDIPQPFSEGIYAACKDSSGNLIELIEFEE